MQANIDVGPYRRKKKLHQKPYRVYRRRMCVSFYGNNSMFNLSAVRHGVFDE